MSRATSQRRRKACPHCRRQVTLTYMGQVGYRWAHRRGQGDLCRLVRERRAELAEQAAQQGAK